MFLQVMGTLLVGTQCYRQSYNRGVGTIPTSCSGGWEYSVGLCYEPCRANYDPVNFVCWERCKAGWADHGVTCHIPMYTVTNNDNGCSWFDICATWHNRGEALGQKGEGAKPTPSAPCHPAGHMRYSRAAVCAALLSLRALLPTRLNTLCGAACRLQAAAGAILGSTATVACAHAHPSGRPRPPMCVPLGGLTALVVGSGRTGCATPPATMATVSDGQVPVWHPVLDIVMPWQPYMLIPCRLLSPAAHLTSCMWVGTLQTKALYCGCRQSPMTTIFKGKSLQQPLAHSLQYTSFVMAPAIHLAQLLPC